MTNTESRPLVIGEFADPREASAAYSWLRERGYDANEVNLMMNESTLEEFNTFLKGTGDGTHTLSGLAIGAAIGATAASLASALIPGANLILAGTLFAALGGASAGTVTGGLIGGMMDLTIPESQATAYEQTLREGGVVLAVLPHDGDRDEICEYFERSRSKLVSHV